MSRYKRCFQPWELRVAKKLAASFLKEHRQLSNDEFEDLLQECLSYWVSVREQYDPQGGASPQTFMWKVICRKLAQIWRKMESDKRKVSHQTVSLTELPGGEAEDVDNYLDRLTSQPGGEIRGSEEHICLKIDLVKVVNQLPPKQKELCNCLGEKDMSVQEISRKLKIPRSTVYDEIKRIRNFHDNGLGEYFKKR